MIAAGFPRQRVTAMRQARRNDDNVARVEQTSLFSHAALCAAAFQTADGQLCMAMHFIRLPALPGGTTFQKRELGRKPIALLQGSNGGHGGQQGK